MICMGSVNEYLGKGVGIDDRDEPKDDSDK